MTDLHPTETAVPYLNTVALTQPVIEACVECLGSGGWYRYEPALEPSPGLLYLSCLHCRGSGRTAEAAA